MNAKELLEWLEERGELYICKADGGSYTVVARAADPIPYLSPKQHTTKADRTGSVIALPTRR